MFTEDYRASKILYNFLRSNSFKGKFLLPANVCEVIPLIFHYAKVDFDFMDIQLDNLCIDQKEVLNHLDEYIGILFVRTYGTEENFESFFQQIKDKKPSFIIIDDSCLCLPDINYTLSPYVDLKLYSVGYAKQVDMQTGAFGFMNDSYRYQEINAKFIESDYDKYKSELFSALSSINLFVPNEYHFLQNIEYKLNNKNLSDKIQLVTEHKKRLNQIYQRELPSNIQLMKEFQNWRFNILVDESVKSVVLKNLFKEGLFASSHYISLSKVWKNKECPNATSLNKKIINLFNDFYYTEEQAISACKIINENL